MSFAFVDASAAYLDSFSPDSFPSQPSVESRSSRGPVKFLSHSCSYRVLYQEVHRLCLTLQSTPLSRSQLDQPAEGHPASRYMDLVEVAFICAVYMYQLLDSSHLLDLASEHCRIPSRCIPAHRTACHRIASRCISSCCQHQLLVPGKAVPWASAP